MELSKQIEVLKLIMTELIPEAQKQELLDSCILMDWLVSVHETIYVLQDVQRMEKQTMAI